ncbi:hypothetical protein IAD21_02304 [Abditibacteriota bacterium]|nr:hypothetical protein IAD21_02304 [Abditibacteriota bacterium]
MPIFCLKVTYPRKIFSFQVIFEENRSRFFARNENYSKINAGTSGV